VNIAEGSLSVSRRMSRRDESPSGIDESNRYVRPEGEGRQWQASYLSDLDLS
jgi:hypothetical protein